MTSLKLDKPPSAWAERSRPFPGLSAMVRDTAAIAEMDLRKLARDPSELFTRAIQPALWLLVFGQVFGRVRAIPTGNLGYLDFLAPGILAQSVLFIAIFYGISVIWERDLGIVHKLLVTPSPRTALVLGKGLSAGVRAVSQGIIIYTLCWMLGVKLDWRPQSLVCVVAAIILGADLFSTFSLIIACIVKTRERFMGIGQVLTMPLFFASNAVYPLAMMPPWLKVIARLNPLTYEVDALRSLMIVGGGSSYGVGWDFAVLLLVTVAMTTIGAAFYPRLAE